MRALTPAVPRSASPRRMHRVVTHSMNALAGVALMAAAACSDIAEPTPRSSDRGTQLHASLAAGGGCAGCVLGPVTLTRNTVDPPTTIFSFGGEPQRSYVLDVDDNGSRGLTGSVKLNGIELVTPQMLAGNGGFHLQTVVALQAQNTLEVRLEGRPGATMTIELRAEAIPGVIPRASMSTPRQWVALATVGGALYAVGGYNGSDLSSMESYDPITDVWSPRAPAPAPRYAGVGLQEIGGKLYLPGGFTLSAYPVPSTTLFVYDPSTDTWGSRAALPGPTGCGASGAIAGRLYVVVGCTSGASYARLLHRYDPASDSWTTLAEAPRGHTYPAAGVIGERLLVAGGYASLANDVSAALDIFDASSGTWVSGPSMHVARAGATAQVLNGRLYVIGGVGANGEMLDDVEVYDPVTNAWAALQGARLATGRLDAGSASIGGTMYVAGGISRPTILSSLEAITP